MRYFNVEVEDNGGMTNISPTIFDLLQANEHITTRGKNLMMYTAKVSFYLIFNAVCVFIAKQ